MTVRFRTRTFLLCFVPFALLLTAGFWMMQQFVQITVREGLKSSLRENQAAVARVHAKSNLQNSRFLKIAGENAALKGGIELEISERRSNAARRTVEDQLRELGEHMGFDFLMISAPDGVPIAAVGRSSNGELAPIATDGLQPITHGLLAREGRVLQVASVPIDENEENIAVLVVGENFDLSEFTTAAVLMHNGRVLQTNIGGLSGQELQAGLSHCAPDAQCNLHIRGENWISLPVETTSLGEGYLLRSLEDVDAKTAPLQLVLHRLFAGVALVSIVVALLCSLISSRSTVKPIAGLVEQLRNSAVTGVLPEFDSRRSAVLEIRELIENYNHAAVAVRDARERLQDAYVEFVGSLANALDARDRYTAGHSKRVSELSCATAAAMQLPPEDVERIRVGALLHDIGKIGVADAVLQKAGRLSDEEFAAVKEHPVIGRWILEGVQGLTPFIPAVELHHENWDGSGYPHGQRGTETPVDARIIHVADAYDAMTTDRSYRRGMTHKRAIEILREYAATQFDPYIVKVFSSLPRDIVAAPRQNESGEMVAAPLEDWKTV